MSLLNIAITLQQAVQLHRQGNSAEAETRYRLILQADPGCGPALQNLGSALMEQGQLAPAQECYERLLQFDIANPVAHGNRGNVLLALGRIDEALDSYNRALQLDPAYARAHSNRCSALIEAGDYEAALRDAERALQLAPHMAEAANNRGKALLLLGQSSEALKSFEHALQLQPGWPLALANRSAALLKVNRPDEALRDADQALRSNPCDAIALNARGCALRALQRYHDAIKSYDQAITIQPRLAVAHYDRGNALLDLGRIPEALSSFDRALQCAPDLAEGHYGRGIALLQLQRLACASEAFSKAAQMYAGLPYARGLSYSTRMQQACWDNQASERDELLAATLGDELADEPFSFLSVSASASAQLRCARNFIRDRHPPRPTPLWRGERYQHSKLRIAYLSGDFGDHPISYLMRGVFEKHDRAQFEVIALSLRPRAASDYGRAVAAAFDRFVDVSAMSDETIAAVVRELEVDIAVDLAGFTRGTRLGVFSHRAAPVQLSYLGYPGTMGAPYFDYLLADEFVIPPASRSNYSEQLVYLPDCFQANDDSRQLQDPPARQQAGLPERGFVFCCFNVTSKLTPELFDIWCRLLRGVPDSVLWLLGEHEAVRSNLRREAQSRGVAPSRLVFAQRLKYPQHLARLQLADLFLDTLPFNAGATANDALWAGVPVLTCAGEAYASRMAGSLLRAAGLPGMITHSLQEYEAKALVLSQRDPLLLASRAALSDQRMSGKLFPTQRFCHHLEHAYRGMNDRVRAGQTSRVFSVDRES